VEPFCGGLAVTLGLMPERALAFAGYAALPAQATASDWARVLKVPDTATADEIITAHRRLAIENHPDRGGDAEIMALINSARDAALKQRANR
jgi:hypothetical protein